MCVQFIMRKVDMIKGVVQFQCSASLCRTNAHM